MIFETHCHLNDDAFKDDLEEVCLRAKNNNVTSMCIIGWDKQSSIDAINICRKYKDLGIKLYPVVGLHPENVKEEQDKDLNWLMDLLNDKSNNIIAIGEIGIDLYWDKSNLEMQKYYFHKQIQIAKEYDLPIIIHTREATQITYDILKEYKDVKGIFHCYSGSIEMAKLISKLGYKLGIGGVLTFKNSHLKEVVENIDLDNFVCETDCPYLSPVPNRGKRNEPANLVYIVEEIARIKNINKLDVENKLYNNALEILRIKDYEKD